MTNSNDAPLLQTPDDRLARMESMLVNAGGRLDRIEQVLSRIELELRELKPKK
jgi:hypothetical protein